MKEIIVITQDWLVKDMKAGVPELDKLFICQKIEQVPETFDELIELCKDKKGVVITDNGNGIYFRYLFFWKEGIIEDENQNLLSEATPERQWQIIKNLIGE